MTTPASPDELEYFIDRLHYNLRSKPPRKINIIGRYAKYLRDQIGPRINFYEDLTECSDMSLESVYLLADEPKLLDFRLDLLPTGHPRNQYYQLEDQRNYYTRQVLRTISLLGMLLDEINYRVPRNFVFIFEHFCFYRSSMMGTYSNYLKDGRVLGYLVSQMPEQISLLTDLAINSKLSLTIEDFKVFRQRISNLLLQEIVKKDILWNRLLPWEYRHRFPQRERLVRWRQSVLVTKKLKGYAQRKDAIHVVAPEYA